MAGGGHAMPGAAASWPEFAAFARTGRQHHGGALALAATTTTTTYHPPYAPASQLTGTAMLRPAASPRACVARATAAARARAAPRARHISITATSASTAPATTDQRVHLSPSAAPSPPPDARFDVVGSPFSLLSVTLAASQTLFTRRGTLVGLSGKAENTLSSLSLLEPIRRAPVAIPFLYQRVSATSPVTALVSPKSPISSIVTVHLDGRQDWLLAQRQTLLAWTGHSLSLRPQYNVKLGLAHWGNTRVTGRGLLALAGNGQIYQVQLKAGESYVAHPRYAACPSPARMSSRLTTLCTATSLPTPLPPARRLVIARDPAPSAATRTRTRARARAHRPPRPRQHPYMYTLYRPQSR